MTEKLFTGTLRTNQPTNQPVSAEYTLIQLLIDSDIVIHNNESNTDSNIRNLVDSLHYHSRRLAYKVHAVRYDKLHLVTKRKRK